MYKLLNKLEYLYLNLMNTNTNILIQHAKNSKSSQITLKFQSSVVAAVKTKIQAEKYGSTQIHSSCIVRNN